MRDRHCLQCGVFIKSGKGWKQESTRRMGGLIHDYCLDKYIQHKKVVSEIKRKISRRIYKLKNKDKVKQWNAKHYRKNNVRIRARVKAYYDRNSARLIPLQTNRNGYLRTYIEKDHEFIVKVWPEWKTQEGWLI